MKNTTDSEPEDLFKRKDSSQWSQLPRDLIRSVFKRLSFGDFERGKSVCWSWYCVSRECYPKNQIPWLILFPHENDNNNCCCKLFNPEEKDKIYTTTQDLGFEKGTKCVATCGCGCWLLMQNHLSNLYIVDLLTPGERIILPPVQSQLGNIKVERIVGDYFRLRTSFVTHQFQGTLTYACQLWVDEETKDYLVMWTLINDCVVICKKGDKFWRQIPPDCSSGFGECRDMVYKDHKLYYHYHSSYSGVNTIRVWDFSGEIPRKVSETIVTTDLSSEPPHSGGSIQ
ncbi:unnamed protein product [Eruca vesicaria subsp. sativa]|uniref:F-box domain-containing protein n=1 Tax=Eruca vesicaria subsp. sativa TaxID=29727 RepID=A0ABC8LI25_ERUVS|nr:unnamed protein product [Eruca vesicaria subsp. sativa]